MENKRKLPMKNYEGHNCGKCFFCLSKCPDCGSANVRVKFNVVLEYLNNTENRLYLDSDLDTIKMECETCGTLLDDKWTVANPKVNELGVLLTKSLVGDQTWLNIDDKGKVKIEIATFEKK